MRLSMFGPLVLLSLMLLGRSVGAQDKPSWEVAGGVSAATARGDFEWLWYPGWTVDVSKAFNPPFALVGSLTDNRRSDASVNGASVATSTYGLLGGLKATVAQQHSVVPFGEILAGVGHSNTAE